MRPVVHTGRYLGGHPDRERASDNANISITAEGVRVGVFKTWINEPWANISELDAEGPDQVGKRITASRLLLTGPLALAWKKETKSPCFIVVRGTFGEFIFEVKKKSVQELRGELAPWKSVLRALAAETNEAANSTALNEPAGAEPASAQAAPGSERLELLKQLGELRASGVLTEEEFAAEKARILSAEE